MHLEGDPLLSSSAQIFLQEADNVWEEDWESAWARGMAQGQGLEGFRFEGDDLFDSPISADLAIGAWDSQREEDLPISVELQRIQSLGNRENPRSSEQGAMAVNVDLEWGEGRLAAMNFIKPDNFSACLPPPQEDMHKMDSVPGLALEKLPSLVMEVCSPCTVADPACSNANIPGGFGSLESPSGVSPASTVQPSSATLQITLVDGLLSCEYEGPRELGSSGIGSVKGLTDARTDVGVEELFLDEKRANCLPQGLSPAYLQGLSQIGNGLGIPEMDQPGQGALYPLFPPVYSSLQGHPIPSSAMRLPNLSDLQGVNVKPAITPLCEVCSTRDMKAIGVKQLGYGSVSSFESDQCSALDENAHKIRKYSVEERKQRIHRYRSKRTKRNFDKKIKYACRKTLADGRSRVRGRFARNEDAGEVDLKANAHPEEDEEEEGDAIHEDEDDDDFLIAENPTALLNGTHGIISMNTKHDSPHGNS